MWMVALTGDTDRLHFDVLSVSLSDELGELLSCHHGSTINTGIVTVITIIIIMATLWNMAGHYIFILWFLSIFFFYVFFFA